MSAQLRFLDLTQVNAPLARSDNIQTRFVTNSDGLHSAWRSVREEERSMNRKIVMSGAVAVALVAIGAAAGVTQSDRAQAQANANAGYGCPGMMGSGMMGPGMMGQGMMMGPGMMGWGWRGQQANVNLSTSDVKANLERWVAAAGNPRVKVGPVTQRDASTITADIVTTEGGALVQRFVIDRNTGAVRNVQ
jgi:hypothetical protein